MKKKILTIKNLSKSYHDKKSEVKALDDINLDVLVTIILPKSITNIIIKSNIGIIKIMVKRIWRTLD